MEDQRNASKGTFSSLDRYRHELPRLHSRVHLGDRRYASELLGRIPFRVDIYPIPGELFDPRDEEDLDLCESNPKSVLTLKNYVSRFQNLLWLEEKCQIANMLRYEQNNVILMAYYDNCYLIHSEDVGSPLFNEHSKISLRHGDASPWICSIEGILNKCIVIKIMKELDVEKRRAVENMRFEVSIELLQSEDNDDEGHKRLEIRRCNYTGVKLTARNNHHYLLPVPGLADGSGPRLTTDYKVNLSQGGDQRWTCSIMGIRTRESDLIIRIEEMFIDDQERQDIEEKRFKVSYEPPRITYRRCHHAINHLENFRKLNGIAFPVGSEDSSEPVIDVPFDYAQLFNQKLNKYQREAVVNILRSVHRPAPYLLFGPPGTGKTATLVETVLQIYELKPNSRILVCGSSNACVDYLTHQLLESEKIYDDELLRLTHMHRKNELGDSDSLSKISKTADALKVVDYVKYRVVTSTCNQACELNQFERKFEFIFVDEAAQANEPETMIPFDLATDDTSLVLAGDPHQLGPVCQSNLAKDYGLGTSLMERLFGLEVYKKREIDGVATYDHEYITKLKISFRCDPRVMVVNNAMFYDNELEFKAKTPEYLLEKLDVKNPLIFKAVRGREERPPRQTSWCNEDEARWCIKYVKQLYEVRLKPDQIGIITPYRAQIRKINKLFDFNQLAKCRVDTVEGFQGDEREVMIISMVRTTPQKNNDFLFDPKRFNVAVSRAKSICILIGNPDVLQTDKCWSKYLKAAEEVKR